ncbi:MAG TPA: DUF2306 domain-containing protein [Gemmatimonadales bacterium]|jgi:uncharacterized membrane protein
MTILALLIAGYAAVVLLDSHVGAPFMLERRRVVAWAVYLHLSGGVLAMALGPWQFSRKIRSKAITVHRWMGRVYVVAVICGGIGGLALATISEGGMVSHLGFGLLALLWLGTTIQGYRFIRAKNRVAHKQWMTRSFALTLAAVTLRIYLPITLMAHWPFVPSYQVISWLCWVPNLFVAEWLLRPLTPVPVAAPRPVPTGLA